jgi:2-polyprenyl-3-methyl-5-hydroxy-6-metoxy-1,4-benzoquinol methylase
VSARYFKPQGKSSFLRSLRFGDKILDVGCGGNPHKLIAINNLGIYFGIDISTPVQENSSYRLSRFILSDSSSFHKDIACLDEKFDYVVSAHNLEHCLRREEVLSAMCSILKIGGKIYLSFPSQESVDFPSRTNTLNYFDDPTHLFSPPNFNAVCKSLNANGLTITYASKSYRPKVLTFLGCLLEPISARLNRVLPGTWAFYGFESIIHATKHSDAPNER